MLFALSVDFLVLVAKQLTEMLWCNFIDNAEIRIIAGNIQIDNLMSLITVNNLTLNRSVNTASAEHKLKSIDHTVQTVGLLVVSPHLAAGFSGRVAIELIVLQVTICW